MQGGQGAPSGDHAPQRPVPAPKAKPVAPSGDHAAQKAVNLAMNQASKYARTRTSSKPAPVPKQRRQAARPAIHGLVTGKEPLAPATPIVTEHTRGQAHGGAAVYGTEQGKRGLPQDQGITPHPGITAKDYKAMTLTPMDPVFWRGVGNIAQDAFYAPAGIALAGSDIGRDVAATTHGDFSFKRTRGLGKAVALSTAESILHPDRRPGDTILNLWAGAGALGGGAARLGAASHALEEGGVRAALTRPVEEGGSLLHKPMSAAREFNVGGRKAYLLPSNNPTFRALQARYDRVLQQAMDENPTGRVAAHAYKRLGHAMQETSHYQRSMIEAPGHVLERAGKNLSAAEQAALRLAAENATPEERIALHQYQQVHSDPENALSHQKQIDLLHAAQAQGLTKGVNGQTVIDAEKAPQLAAVDTLLARVGSKMDEIVTRTGQMDEEALASRRGRPNIVAATHEPVTEKALAQGARGQLSLLEPETAPGRQYVPYFQSETKGPLGGIGRASSPVVGKGRAPITATQHFTGESQLAGHVPDNTTGLVARAFYRQARYAATDALRRKVASMGSDVRRSNRDVLVNTQELKNAKVPEETQVQVGNRRPTLDELEHDRKAETAFEDWRRRIFPHEGDVELPGDGKAPKGYKWVDKGLLGDLAEQPPQLGRIGEKVAKGFDQINSAQTVATVYTKPGHIATRTLTNAATNILSGAAHPSNIRAAWKLWQELTPEERTEGMAASGEGGIHALPHEGASLISRGARRGSAWWARRIDSPFRFNSLVREARRVGIRTPEQFKQMLHDMKNPHEVSPERADFVDRIAKNANREAIAYDRLSPFEKTYVRRAIWFYPWIKGATIFAGRTALEHPIKTAGLANLGVVGQGEAAKVLGAVPSYARGLFPVRHDPIQALLAAAGLHVHNPTGTVLTSNPSTLSPFSTPAEVLNLASHYRNPGAAETLAGMLTPAAKIGIESAIHRDVESGDALKNMAPWDVALHNLETQTPEVTLLRRLQANNKSAKAFQYTPLQSVEQTFTGAESPKSTNVAKLNADALKDQVAAANPGEAQQLRLTSQLKSVGARITPDVQQVITYAAMRANARANYPKNAHGYFHGDLDVLVKLGQITPAERAQKLAWAATKSNTSLTQAMLDGGTSLDIAASSNAVFDPKGIRGYLKDALKQKKQASGG